VVALLDREPALLPWLDADLKEADSLRRVAEDKLLWKGLSTWDVAFDKLQSARKKYEASLVAFNILRDGRVYLDRAFIELPVHMKLLCDWPDFDVPADQSWSKAADEAMRLQAFFESGPRKDSQELVKLDAHGRELKRHLQDLGKTLGRRIARVNKEDKAGELQQTLVLLESALLTAPQRMALFARQRSLGKKLNDANNQLDQEDKQANRLSPLDAPSSADAFLSLARARMSLALLRLGKFNLKGKNVAVPDVDGKITPQEWANLEDRLQDFWQKDLPAQWHNAKPGATADALNRILSPWELDRWAGNVERSPSRVWQEQLRNAYLRWLQERYRSEATILDVHEWSLAVFYAEAAQELRLKSVELD
jgi:hypothetical protein